MKDYLVEYEHDGATWGFTLKAIDFDDARRRVAVLASAQLMGQVGQRIEAPRGAHLSPLPYQKG